VTISGLRFRPGRVQVRFGGEHARTEATVDAEFVDACTIRCKTPNFEACGAGTVNVCVSIGGESWTVNRVGFTYFANTAARNCLAFGPGLLPSPGPYGLSLPFLIQARDTLNDRRRGGGDEFVVRVTAAGDGGAASAAVEGAASRICDLGTGLYEAHYSVPAAGTYQVGCAACCCGARGAAQCAPRMQPAPHASFPHAQACGLSPHRPQFPPCAARAPRCTCCTPSLAPLSRCPSAAAPSPSPCQTPGCGSA
jgi:hypothetical protein